MQYTAKELDDIMNTNVRWPKWTIKLWDAKLDSINKIALGTATQTPYDISSKNSDLQITRVGGMNASQATIQVVDESLNPENGSNRKYVQHQQIITIDIGDERVTQTMRIFVGYIWGRAGYSVGRDSAKVVSLTAYGREIKYNQNALTSKLYNPGLNITDVITDYAQQMMGLTEGEIRLSRMGKILQLPTQFVGIKPSEVLLDSFFPPNFSAGFDGNGFLKNYDMAINKSPNRIYGLDMRKGIEIPQSSNQVVDRVTVSGLDADLAYVVQDHAMVAKASVTIDWRTSSVSLPLKWSEDGTKRVATTSTTIDRIAQATGKTPKALELRLKLRSSDMIWAQWQTYTDYDGTLQILNPFGPFSYKMKSDSLIAGYLIPDPVFAAGWGATIPITPLPWPAGGLVTSWAQTEFNEFMKNIPHGEWEVWGCYYDTVHKEVKHISQAQNLDIYQINNREITNQLINSRGEAKSISNREYYLDRYVRSQDRVVTMVADYTLEPYDIMMFEDGRAFMATSISYSFVRGSEAMMTVNCYALNSIKGAA